MIHVCILSEYRDNSTFPGHLFLASGVKFDLQRILMPVKAIPIQFFKILLENISNTVRPNAELQIVREQHQTQQYFIFCFKFERSRNCYLYDYIGLLLDKMF